MCLLPLVACDNGRERQSGGSAGDGEIDPGTAGAGAAGRSGNAGSGSAGRTGSAGAGAAGHAGSAGAGGTGGAKVDAGAPDKGATGSAGAGGAGTSGAAGAGGSTDDPPLTYSAYIGPVLELSCGGCHLITESLPFKGGFGLSYANLMASVTSDHMGCPNLDASKKRVVPGKPENSLIYIKVSVANPPGSCGGHMPANGVNMSTQQLTALHDWIAQGAKP
jgi:hypothetical protein